MQPLPTPPSCLLFLWLWPGNTCSVNVYQQQNPKRQCNRCLVDPRVISLVALFGQVMIEAENAPKADWLVGPPARGAAYLGQDSRPVRLALGRRTDDTAVGARWRPRHIPSSSLLPPLYASLLLCLLISPLRISPPSVPVLPPMCLLLTPPYLSFISPLFSPLSPYPQGRGGEEEKKGRGSASEWQWPQPAQCLPPPTADALRSHSQGRHQERWEKPG